MDELVDIQGVAIPEEVIFKLTKLLGSGKMIRLVELLEGVIEDTGYGDIKIVVA